MVSGLRELASAIGALLAALFLPDRGVPPLVAGARFRLALVVVIAAAVLAAAAGAARLDLGPEVRAENAERHPISSTERARPGTAPGAGSGSADDLAEVKTDQQLHDEIAKRTAVMEVKLGLGAVLGTPFQILLIACFLYVLGAYVGGKPTFGRALAAASVGALPWAVRSLVAAAAAWRQTAVRAADLDRLVGARLSVGADHPLLARLAGRVDLFALWAVVLWGFGLAAAAGLGRARAMVTVVVGFTLYVLISTAGAR